jgi:hypothetical protein
MFHDNEIFKQDQNRRWQLLPPTPSLYASLLLVLNLFGIQQMLKNFKFFIYFKKIDKSKS